MATVTSIRGLQNVTNLTSFSADWNSLVSIDFSGLTNLLEVDISDCTIPGSNTPSLRFVNLSGCESLEELRLDDSDFSTGIPNLTGLDSLEYIDMDQCGITGNVDLSMLPALTGFDLSGNPGLTSVTIFEQVLNDVNIRNAALTEASVNDILGWLDGGGETGGTVRLEGGTNAVPTGDGLTAVTNLQGKGWNVNVSESPLPFDVTANWSLTTPPVVDEASFRTFLSGNLANTSITDFQLVNGRLTCNLVNYSKDVLYFQNLEITDADKFGNFVRLEQINLDFNQIVTFDPSLPLSDLTALTLRSNQIVTFNPTLPLPDSLASIFLNDNQMTTAGYIGSEPWANAMSVIPGRGTVYISGNVDSVSGTDLETILISKGWTVIA